MSSRHKTCKNCGARITRGHSSNASAIELQPNIGISMRDFFAAQILQGMLTGMTGILLQSGGIAARYTDWSNTAYALADAMLVVRANVIPAPKK